MAKLGTRPADLCRGLICICESSLWGGVILCIFLLLDAVFLYYRDIVSVAKLKNSFWSAAGGASYYVAFSHSLI